MSARDHMAEDWTLSELCQAPDLYEGLADEAFDG